MHVRELLSLCCFVEMDRRWVNERRITQIQWTSCPSTEPTPSGQCCPGKINVKEFKAPFTVNVCESYMANKLILRKRSYVAFTLKTKLRNRSQNFAYRSIMRSQFLFFFVFFYKRQYVKRKIWFHGHLNLPAVPETSNSRACILSDVWGQFSGKLNVI